MTYLMVILINSAFGERSFTIVDKVDSRQKCQENGNKIIKELDYIKSTLHCIEIKK